MIYAIGVALGGVLKIIKLEFGGLKGQFDVTKVDFRGLKATNGYCRTILASRSLFIHLHNLCHRDYVLRYIISPKDP